MKNLFGVFSFALSIALAEHAFIQMSEHSGIFRLDSPVSWLVIVPLFIAGVYTFFSGSGANENNR